MFFPLFAYILLWWHWRLRRSRGGAAALEYWEALQKWVRLYPLGATPPPVLQPWIPEEVVGMIHQALKRGEALEEKMLLVAALLRNSVETGRRQDRLTALFYARLGAVLLVLGAARFSMGEVGSRDWDFCLSVVSGICLIGLALFWAAPLRRIWLRDQAQDEGWWQALWGEMDAGNQDIAERMRAARFRAWRDGYASLQEDVGLLRDWAGAEAERERSRLKRQEEFLPLWEIGGGMVLAGLLLGAPLMAFWEMGGRAL